MLKILLAGHACAPGIGSEPGVTWSWATNLAAHNEVWVLCHPQYRGEIEAHLSSHPIPNLHFHWVNLPAWRNPWQPGQSDYRLRIHYLMWQRQLVKDARRLHQEIGFDIAHQVSWTTVTAPTPLWELPIPAIWGPVGGAITTPPAFLSYFGSQQRSEKIRSLRVKLLPHLPNLRRAAKHLTVAFATNRETTAFLRQTGVRDVRFLGDQGLKEEEMEFALNHPMPERDTLELVWAGRLEHRKALPIVLEAMAQLPKDFSVRLRVAGTGPLGEEWKALAQKLGVGHQVEFLGLIPLHEVRNLILDSHALLFSSLRDAYGTVVMEAMTCGRAVITLDHQGIGASVPATAALKVPVTEPAATIAAYAQAIQSMGNRILCLRMGESARTFMLTQGWRERARIMTECYREVSGRAAPATSTRSASTVA